MQDDELSRIKAVLDKAIKLIGTWRDANDIGDTLNELEQAVEALEYKPNYKEID